MHVASLIYFYSNFIHQKRIHDLRHPADFLNSVLVNVSLNVGNNYESSNNPQYVKNRRRALKDIISSDDGSESDDGSDSDDRSESNDGSDSHEGSESDDGSDSDDENESDDEKSLFSDAPQSTTNDNQIIK